PRRCWMAWLLLLRAGGVGEEGSVAPAGCPNPSFAFPRPFPMLAVTRRTTTVDPRSPDGRVVQGQDPAVRSLRRRRRRLPHRGQAARPPRAGRVPPPGPQPWPGVAPRRAAGGRLGRGDPWGGGERVECAAVQAAARPWRRPAPRGGPGAGAPP